SMRNTSPNPNTTPSTHSKHTPMRNSTRTASSQNLRSNRSRSQVSGASIRPRATVPGSDLINNVPVSLKTSSRNSGALSMNWEMSMSIPISAENPASSSYSMTAQARGFFAVRRESSPASMKPLPVGEMTPRTNTDSFRMSPHPAKDAVAPIPIEKLSLTGSH